ncbi:cytochrome P450 71AU50-like [Tripterygium wilfordii]|uniref:cytochrome P450 71AU50-like n=1 Tax=Tripterygium wilfordii TaxID=458696 RepID=UPI0018F821F3|nr:cytochrome P450 71AU50-like [Tripterygium wilfordii]
MVLTWTSIAIVALAFFLQLLLRKMRSTQHKKLPPGPKGLPILGCLHMLGKFPHKSMHQLSKKYGPIMYMKLGLIPTVVVSSPQAAELFLKTHDLVFASRPSLEAAKYISYEQTNLSFAPYGSYWRNMRKMCTLELLSNLKLNAFKSMRWEEIKQFVEHVKGAAKEGVVVDVSAKVSTLSADMTCRMVFGKKYMDKDLDERGFKAVIQEGMQLSATPNVSDYIPQIASLDLQGLRKQMKAVSKVFDNFFEKIIDEHIQHRDEDKVKDFVDVMLGIVGSKETEYSIDSNNIKAVILDMLAGGMDTSATAVEWAMSELIRHPRAMKKLQKELKEVVGMNRMVEESDLEKLDYLDMVVKESMRLRPVAPLLLPHESIEDCIVNGFHIPRKSRIIINVWSIGRDPSAWTDAEKFIPERFEGSNVDLRGHDFKLLPFGSGRRGCPGLQLGLTMVRLMLAQMVHCFDWELPDNMLATELDMTEEFALVTPRAKHLMAIPTYRLHH